MDDTTDVVDGKRKTSRMVATYDYRDAAGELLYQVVRLDPKSFRQRRPDGRGGWIWDLKGVTPTLYRLPELADPGNSGNTVFVVEGEKDTDRLAAKGLLATCNSGGATHFPGDPVLLEVFRDREVVILPDNDDKGRQHAQDVAKKLAGIASDIRVVEIPGLPEKGDVSDFLDAGGTIEQLDELISRSTTWALPVAAKVLPASTTIPKTTWRGDRLERARDYLGATPAAVAGEGGHAATFAVACVIVRGFDLTEDEAFQVFASWNARCEPPWSEKELRHKIADAMKRADGEPGYMLKRDRLEYRRRSNRDIPAPDIAEPEPPPVSSRFDPGPIPEQLLHPPGFLDEFVAWSIRTAYRPQPELALAAGLATLSTLSGRLVHDVSGTYPNVYLAAVCETGGGKEHPRNCAKRVLDCGGMGDRILEGAKSGAGVIAALAEGPVRLLAWDEFGIVLQSLSSSTRTPPHLIDLKSKLLSIFSAVGTTYAGDAAADFSKRVTIKSPFLSLMGSSTPATLFDSLNSESVLSGFLGRPLFFFGRDGVRLRSVSYEDVPQVLREYAEYWRDAPGDLANISGDFDAPPRVLDYDAAANECFSRHIEFTEDRRALIRDEWERALRVREVELVRRLAILHAISVDPSTLTIDEAAVRWAIAIVEQCVLRLVFHASTRIAASGYEADCLEVLRYIRERPDAMVTRSELLRKFRRIKATDFDKLTEHLTATGELRAEVIQTATKSKLVYRCLA